MAKNEVATERLAGRPWRAEDWPFLWRLQTDPRSGPWIARRGVEATEEAARAAVARIAAHWAAQGFAPVGPASGRRRRICCSG